MAAQPQEEWEEVLLSLIAGGDQDEDLFDAVIQGADGETGDEGADRPGAGGAVEGDGRTQRPGVVPAMVGVDPGPVAVARAGLEGLGLSAESASGWVDLLVAQVGADGTEAVGVPVPTQDGQVLSAMGAMARSSAALEASLLVSVQDLVLSTASRLLAEGNVEDPRSMSKTAHQTWRVAVKSAVAGELQVLLGVGIGQARALVAIATYPGVVRGPILAALRRGEVSRPLVMAFQQATRRLVVDQAARVANALFGQDADTAAVERLDVEGVLELGRPWHHGHYYAALKREVARVQAEDENAAEDERAAAHQGRDVRMRFEDDGTATLAVTMATITGAAVMARIEDMSRRARAGGDQRTLAQLRADIIAILLLHGIVTLPGDHASDQPCGDSCGESCTGACHDTDGGADETSGKDALFDEIVTPEDVEALRAIITATPAGHVDLVIPWDAALGAVCPTCTGPMTTQPPGTHPPRPHSQGDDCAPAPSGKGDRCAASPGEGAECAASPGEGDEPAQDRVAGEDPVPDRSEPQGEPRPGPAAGAQDFTEPHSGCPSHAICRTDDHADTNQAEAAGTDHAGTPDKGHAGTGHAGTADAAHGGVGDRQGFLAGTSPGRVGELIGWASVFITPAQARQIILTPGSLVGRLLYAPADGRCLERSIKRYAPDTDMRRQVRAADVYSRGPGSRRPATQSELDHEKEWATHAWTAETNLNHKALLEHHRKTKRTWRSVMNRRRDLTWTTLLRQVATTRGHDYRQYLQRVLELTPANPTPTQDTGRSEQDRADLAARRDLLNQLIYAAIVHRHPGQRTEADDDIPGSEDWLTIGDWAQVTHTDQHGQHRRGGPPGHPTPEQILNLHHQAKPQAREDQGQISQGRARTGDEELSDDAGKSQTSAGDSQTDKGPHRAPAADTPWGTQENQRPQDEPPPF